MRVQINGYLYRGGCEITRSLIVKQDGVFFPRFAFSKVEARGPENLNKTLIKLLIFGQILGELYQNVADYCAS